MCFPWDTKDLHVFVKKNESDIVLNIMDIIWSQFSWMEN